MTEYERRRLENMKRNAEMLAALKVHSHLSDLAATSKRQRVEWSHKSLVIKGNKKPDAEAVIRRSLRTQGKLPESNGLPGFVRARLSKTRGWKPRSVSLSTQVHPVVEGPISFKEAYDGDGSYRAIVEKFAILMKTKLDKTHGGEKCMASSTASVYSSSTSEVKRKNLGEPRDLKLESQNITNLHLGSENGERTPRNRSCSNGISTTPAKIERAKSEDSDNENIAVSVKFKRVEFEESIDLKSFKSEYDNVARVGPGRIHTVRFLPTTEMSMVVTGSNFGHVSFWDVKQQSENDANSLYQPHSADWIHLYQPHSAPVSEISMHPFSLSKMYTSSYDGSLRLMNIEREEFDLIYSSSTGSALFSLSQRTNNAYSVYFGEGEGILNMIDARLGEITRSWSLHDSQINSIDFNLANPNIMATSSSDGFAHVWDLRKMDVNNPCRTVLQSVFHKHAVYSAYFSRSGISMATTR